MSRFLEIQRDRIHAWRQRRDLRRTIGVENVAEAESRIVAIWQEFDGDEEIAKAAVNRWAEMRYRDAGSIITIVALVQLAILIYRILKHFGWLCPNPEQLESIFLEPIGDENAT
jgi:hypothetical protein